MHYIKLVFRRLVCDIVTVADLKRICLGDLLHRAHIVFAQPAFCRRGLVAVMYYHVYELTVCRAALDYTPVAVAVDGTDLRDRQPHVFALEMCRRRERRRLRRICLRLGSLGDIGGGPVRLRRVGRPRLRRVAAVPAGQRRRQQERQQHRKDGQSRVFFHFSHHSSVHRHGSLVNKTAGP